MELTDHTTFDEIRSLLGVSAKELADTVIQLPHWTLAVDQDVREIDGGAGGVMAQFAVVKGVVAGSRTAAQAQFFTVLNMYVLYHMGLQLVQQADVFSPTTITDGKASITRLQARFDKLRPALEGGLQRFKDRLKEALVALDPAAAIPVAPARVYIVAVPLGTDPVTGV